VTVRNRCQDYCHVFGAVYLPWYIFNCIYHAVYLELLCLSAVVNLYSELVLYICVSICHSIYICHGLSATVSAVLYMYCSICFCVCAAVYLTWLSATVYPTVVSNAVHPMILFVAAHPTLVSNVVYLRLGIFICVSATVSVISLRAIKYTDRD